MADRTVVAATREVARRTMSEDELAVLYMLDRGQVVSAINAPAPILARLLRAELITADGVHEQVDALTKDPTYASRVVLTEYGRRKCRELREAGVFEDVLDPNSLS